jgi:hypothetical protein
MTVRQRARSAMAAIVVAAAVSAALANRERDHLRQIRPLAGSMEPAPHPPSRSSLRCFAGAPCPSQPLPTADRRRRGNDLLRSTASASRRTAPTSCRPLPLYARVSAYRTASGGMPTYASPLNGSRLKTIPDQLAGGGGRACVEDAGPGATATVSWPDESRAGRHHGRGGHAVEHTSGGPAPLRQHQTRIRTSVLARLRLRLGLVIVPPG